jgi:quercetin dioxygenase-like cupin family protein
MVRAGDTIENPLSGERIRFDVTGAESDGQYFRGRIVLAPHGAGPPEHVHPVIEERFRIVTGTLTARVAGAQREYGPGEEIVVPPGTPHRWWNTTDQPLEVDFDVRPALPLDRFLENVFAMAHLGLTNGHGLPNPVRMAPILRRHWDVLHLAGPPLFVQKAVMGVCAIIARLLRYPAEYAYPYERTSTAQADSNAGGITPRLLEEGGRGSHPSGQRHR